MNRDVKTTVDTFQLHPAARLMNRFGSVLESTGIYLIPMQLDSMIRAAERETGLHDWGDEQYLADMQVLFRSVTENPQMSTLGRYALWDELRKRLRIRLKIIHLHKQHPAMQTQPVTRPLIIIGLPRTGTTLLHNLLALDPQWQAPLLWQMLEPYPLTDPADQVQARLRRAQTYARMAAAVSSSLMEIHSVQAEQPEECVFLLPQSMYFYMRTAHQPYREWYLGRGTVPDYQYFRQQLQALQWGQPARRWVLKTPFHLFSLEGLMQVFPDAYLIQTHRDPQMVLPSWASLCFATLYLHLKQVDLSWLGQEALRFCQDGIERSLRLRERHPTSFVDLYYDDLRRDPIQAIRGLYAQVGATLTDSAAARMRAWLDTQHHLPHRNHRYDPAQFGLDMAGVRAAFADYRQRFAIPDEV
jgi:hypothetical protein